MALNDFERLISSDDDIIYHRTKIRTIFFTEITDDCAITQISTLQSP